MGIFVLNGVPLELDYVFHKGEQMSLEHPGAEEYVEITEVCVEGSQICIFELLTEDQLSTLSEMVEKELRSP